MSIERVIDISKARPDLSELGSSGLKRHGGVIAEEFLKELQGSRGAKIYAEMRDNDPVIGAILFVVDMLLRGITWRVDPVDAAVAEDKSAAAFVASCMEDMSHTWSAFIGEVLTFLTYGWSFHEIVYKRRGGESDDPTKDSKYTDGKIGWRKIPLRAQTTLVQWDFDSAGGIQGMTQTAMPNYNRVTIPIERALLFRTTCNKNSPEGHSILRNAYRPWYFKKRIEEIEGIGIERDLAGLPFAAVPAAIMSPSASADEKAVYAAVKDIVINVRRNAQEGVVFPNLRDKDGNPLYEFKLLSTGGSRQFDTNAIIQRFDQRIATTVLADFILLGSGKVGSYALSQDKTDLFTTALTAWLREIKDVLNLFAAPRLLTLNSMQGQVRFEYSELRERNLTDVALYVKELSAAGMPLFPDTRLETYLRSVANLPEAEATE